MTTTSWLHANVIAVSSANPSGLRLTELVNRVIAHDPEKTPSRATTKAIVLELIDDGALTVDYEYLIRPQPEYTA